MLRSNKVNITT